jgi:hypothetical protein
MGMSENNEERGDLDHEGDLTNESHGASEQGYRNAGGRAIKLDLENPILVSPLNEDGLVDFSPGQEAAVGGQPTALQMVLPDEPTLPAPRASESGEQSWKAFFSSCFSSCLFYCKNDTERTEGEGHVVYRPNEGGSHERDRLLQRVVARD